jgi:DNA repair exonuclease SbcCD nuclease subunit
MAINVLATSDLHLGRRSSGLPQVKSHSSAIYTWNRITELCFEHEIDLLLISGDVIDRENLFFESVSPLVNGLRSLIEQDISVCLVAGNHDYNSLADAVGRIDSPKIHLLGQEGSWESCLLDLPKQKVQVVGRSFTGSSLKSDPLQNFNESEVEPDIPTIGIVHGEVDASDSQYGPIDRDRLIESKVDAWFIGHIHKPQILREQNPLICYPGSPHAFSASEPGRHGPWLIEISDERSYTPEQTQLSPVRYEKVQIDISDIQNKNDFRQTAITRLMDFTEKFGTEIDPVHNLIYDVEVKGETDNPEEIDLWSDEINNFFEQLTAPDVMISVRKVTTTLSPNLEGLREWAGESNPAGMLADLILKLREGREDPLISELIEKWKVGVDKANRADVYRPLRKKQRHIDPESEEARRYLQKESERLLMYLIRQQQSERSEETYE